MTWSQPENVCRRWFTNVNFELWKTLKKNEFYCGHQDVTYLDARCCCSFRLGWKFLICRLSFDRTFVFSWRFVEKHVPNWRDGIEILGFDHDIAKLLKVDLCNIRTSESSAQHALARWNTKEKACSTHHRALLHLRFLETQSSVQTH